MEKLYAELAEVLEIDQAEVRPEMSLAEHNWDSLAIVSTIAIVDELFNVTLDGSALGKCQTVADIQALIEKAKA
ncbi:acyl carrier protein [Pandoraea apista]|uniref:Acyl carrier protein n=1 Tax=Pandoraea apista TaxID=93218 RepID=A0ABX9ZNW1_9BURK|nr:acyl carrier protein [Pandoraea apista]PTD99367.1 acyl carrier protein [Pandoraea apista]RRJ31612.1 acyl carrier protein [Pandoraea apista]RRJ81309.1 acyl carrier protein [Pandoraea apista]RRW96344.1 acyl carrier protein [Pandoraea apista]RRX03536.1 acyl carrier protein [Pandoraea apista]